MSKNMIVLQIVTKTGEKILCVAEDQEAWKAISHKLLNGDENIFFDIQSYILNDFIYDQDIVISLNQTSIESLRIFAEVGFQFIR